MDSPTSKRDYKAHLASAIEWNQENPAEKDVTAARIFNVKPQSIQMALKRMKQKDHKAHGGNNKILLDTQSEAVQVYCQEQHKARLGAIKQMVFTAISNLLSQEQPLQEPSFLALVLDLVEGLSLLAYNYNKANCLGSS
jgi:hypothetical protein